MLDAWFLAIALVCPPTLVVNKTVEPWNNRDSESMNHAANRCKHFYPQSPCLKRFIKTKPLSYHAICSAKQKRGA